MTTEKQNELIIHLLVSIQSQVQTTRDFLFANMARQEKWTQQKTEQFQKGFEDSVLDKQKHALEQIRLYYKGDLGDVDDLISRL